MRNLIQGAISLWRNTAGSLKRIPVTNLAANKQTLIVDNHLRYKLRTFLHDLRYIMEGSSSSSLHPSLQPPACVQGMTKLERENFAKVVKLPGVKLPKRQIQSKQKILKPLLLKLKGLSAIGELANDDPQKSTHSLVLLDPGKIEQKVLPDVVTALLSEFGFDADKKYELELKYENWSVSDIFKAVLPEESDGVSSYTQIGHIAHLNLKPENMPFKNIIGQVIIDKLGSVKTVVNKLQTIDNTYRNFEMELLAGENNYITQTKENNCVFELDFSKVYWNSRLSTEHQRITDAVQQDSVVYDIFAGVGPFAVPLAKRKQCTVFANDLNPHSFQSLERNVVLNKIKTGHIYTHNSDGREFIKTKVKEDLIKRLNDAHSKISAETDVHKEAHGKLLSKCDLVHQRSYAVMNLPALAVDFLDSFASLLCDLPGHLRDLELIDAILPVVYCYAFCSKSGNVEVEVKERAEKVLKQALPQDATVRIVRNVSPNKEMVCLSFKVWSQLVLGESESESVDCKESGNKNLPESDTEKDEPISKKQKLHS